MQFCILRKEKKEKTQQKPQVQKPERKTLLERSLRSRCVFRKAGEPSSRVEGTGHAAETGCWLCSSCDIPVEQDRSIIGWSQDHLSWKRRLRSSSPTIKWHKQVLHQTMSLIMPTMISSNGKRQKGWAGRAALAWWAEDGREDACCLSVLGRGWPFHREGHCWFRSWGI